ncbi:MAG: hypothetical protein ACLQVI_01900 [Polyangiaceae bacterium]
MNAYRKIANANHEEIACATTRSTSRHGVSPSRLRTKRAYNRAAKRLDARWHQSSQEAT